MKITRILISYWRRLKTQLIFWKATRQASEPEPDLRSELFSLEQMEHHGLHLAGQHRLSPRSASDRLLARLADNETVLVNSCKILTAATLFTRNRRVPPAAEWLLDNYYLVEEQIHTAQKHLPKKYSRELPELANGPSAGLPRVYDIALENISHGDGRVNSETLSRFIAAYQTMTPLTLGELWAVPIMLRLALIENLRRVASRVMTNWHDRNLAVDWARRMIEIAERDPKNVVLAVAGMARSKPPMTSSFVAELARRLQGQNAALVLPLTWMEQLLSESNLSIEQMVQMETQQQAADQVSISNCMASLRLLSTLNWREFVESLSIVEQILREDPAGVYKNMDFATRDHYRHVVEKLAKNNAFPEAAVARTALELAKSENAAMPSDFSRGARQSLEQGPGQASTGAVRAHVGFYLIDKGLPRLKRHLAAQEAAGEIMPYPPSSSGRLFGRLPRHFPGAWAPDALRRLRQAPLAAYLGSVLALTLLFAWPFLHLARQSGWHGLMLALFAAPIMLISSQLALGLVNWMVTLLIKPAALPRMDYSEGLPPEARTLVVIPTMISSPQNIEDLVEKLEVRYLANRDPHLYFGLLTDFMDAPAEILEQDAELLQLAREQIEALNKKYSDAEHFFLCHRPRRWNPSENLWMGYERKRGKLFEFNELLHGRGRERFSLLVGAILQPQPESASRESRRGALPARYVITLDTDTQLPRDAARQLVGAMAHPLNRPVYDPEKRRVISGYGILQPRVGVSLSSAARSAYARLFGSGAGIDPYTRAVSDVYQDLFGEGSFIGKGIYDVSAFEQALNDRFPDNLILSHDLIEGCHARSGLLSDVQLYEEHPARYSDDVHRRHRWIRGDWQLLPWVFPRVPARKPAPDGAYERNPLTALSRWKIIDNLRRSLLPPALLAMFPLGWFGVSQPALWTLAILVQAIVPPLLTPLPGIFRKPPDVRLNRHLAQAFHHLGQQGPRAVLALIWLPHEALYSLDALTRTLWRMFFSRRHLMQWNPSHEVERNGENDLKKLYRVMWIGPLLSALLFGLLILSPPGQASWAIPVLAAPFLLLWLASPAIAWRISRPTPRQTFAPTPAEQRFLHLLSRRTWAFFERYVGPEDNWLPPDNIQERTFAHIAQVAHRTSPTNMGMALLAHLAAYDFGYLSAGRLLERLDKSLAAMAGLPRHLNHFYNWYDTRSLEPLTPQYISTVDSGNLAGHLLTLSPGLSALADDQAFDKRLLAGLNDTVGVLNEALSSAGIDNRHGQVFQARLDAARSRPPQSLQAAASCLQGLLKQAETIDATLAILLPLSTPEAPDIPEILDTAGASGTKGGPGPDSDVLFWSRTLLAQCRDIHDDIDSFVLPPDVVAADQTLDMPTWRQLSQLDPAGLNHSHAGGRALPLESIERAAEVQRRATARIANAERLARLSTELADMDFVFLYDTRRDLFSIGYNVDERRMDSSYYDLLASESRLTNFVAIAQGQLPQESWFTLGRLLTSSGGVPVLLSWSGTMFEYLMPLLVMPSYEGTLLDQTCRAAVARQIEYGHQLGLPWGVSESGYNTVDSNFNYQYRAFGVPGLGLKRGLGEDLVVAPYASALALMVAPGAACRNLRQLAAQGLSGRFGLYEAVDYTPARLPQGKSSVVIRSFMAHHQGMSLLALAKVLLDSPMQRRFESDPQFQATTLLLQERIPKTAPEYLHTSTSIAINAADKTTRSVENKLRIFTNPDLNPPAVQLLSNGQYHVMVSSAGGGYSRYRDLAVTRWHEDGTRDNWGMFCFLRDVASGEFWSATHQPTLKRTELFQAIFSDARAEFRVRERGFDAHTEIVVSPEDDIELRRIHITNRSRVRRTIEFTSYAEVVLAPAISDALHPAFSNLFVQTELLRHLQAIICTRRPRSSQEKSSWMCHLLAVHGADIDAISYETDRARFIGRGRSLTDPAAMDDIMGENGIQGLLSNSAGSVLDPIVAIRCRITLDAGETVKLDLVTGISGSREGCLQLIDKYRDRNLADRVFDLAWTHSQVLLHQLNASLFNARLYEQMASSIIYANSALRAETTVLAANTRNQSGLWGQGISGDLPIVLLKINDSENIELVSQMVRAHAYWRLKGLEIDLVIWNDEHPSYRQRLQDLIMGLVPSGVEARLRDRPGGIFVRPAQQLSPEDRILIQSVARMIISDTHGTLAEQVRRQRVAPRLPRFKSKNYPVVRTGRPATVSEPAPAIDNLILRNPYGGFSADGSEYVITLQPGQSPPAPWSNILANPEFGTIISESGGSYTWSENAHEFRLTPWGNDPVGDESGEALYLRDEESGHYWSPTPLPRRGNGSYTTRHGFGYSVFEHIEDGIRSELWVYVALDAPVKFFVLKVRNMSSRPRRLSATGYVEWVLGDLRPKSAMHVATEFDPITGTMFARNAYSMEFPGRVAFFDVNPPGHSLSGDRNEFIGRNGSLRAPAAMSRTHLSGRAGIGLDPCGAVQVGFDLDAGDSREIVFRLGAAQSGEAALELAQRLRGTGAANAALDAVRAHWRDTLGKVRVQTPDPSVNVLVNGWLMYQIIACRFWARSGYYQSGGAFGFRDQLQDSMAMLHTMPQSARQHLLLCAAHQFTAGDVQHWWHPPLDRGVRTQCSDDYLWLALATSRYVRVTGDLGVLDEQAGYIKGRPLNSDEESYYDLPEYSQLSETLYQHCVRAIEHGLRSGAHGLPLIGSGDWNDGMNRVGEQGQGESVWLGFFLYDLLLQFAEVARGHGDDAFAGRCGQHAAMLRENLEKHGWDGAWYRRAYFDDGTPMGSASNDECRIDSIAQSWSVLSGAAPDARRRQAMESLNNHLVRRDAGLIQLLDPPFDKSVLDPGYIKGYVPGVRENGGQYTHAAIWAIMAFAALGDSGRAWELLRMINPVNHGDSAAAIEVYKVEPYVMSADVYAVPPHTGRGGWTWYTGSAGWMYRLIVESLLGLRVEGERLRIRPLLPEDWSEFKLHYRFRETNYHISVLRSSTGNEITDATDATGATEARGKPGGVQHIILDGVVLDSLDIPLVNDGIEHQVEISY